MSLNFPLFPENVNVISMAPVLVWKQFKVQSPCCLCYVHCLYVDTVGLSLFNFDFRMNLHLCVCPKMYATSKIAKYQNFANNF